MPSSASSMSIGRSSASAISCGRSACTRAANGAMARSSAGVYLLAVYLLAADNCDRPLQSRLPGVNETVIASQIRILEPYAIRFASWWNTPAPRRLTMIILLQGLPRLGLGPWRHAEEQHLP